MKDVAEAEYNNATKAHKINDYFKHKADIPLGIPGEFSKVTEEYLELKDAYTQNKKLFSIIESADLINSIGKLMWTQYKLPLIIILLIMLIRKPYKAVRNLLLTIKYGKRTTFYTNKKD